MTSTLQEDQITEEWMKKKGIACPDGTFPTLVPNDETSCAAVAVGWVDASNVTALKAAYKRERIRRLSTPLIY